PVGEALGWRAGVGTTALLCAVAAVAFVLLVPRSRSITPRPRTSTGLLTRLARPLRSGSQLALYGIGFLLMGAFVAVYNYLGFHLAAPPFLLPAWITSMLFLAYLAGTVSSPWAGALVARHGRRAVLLWSVLVAGA